MSRNDELKLLGELSNDPWLWSVLPPAPGGKKPGKSFYPGAFRDLEKKLRVTCISKFDFFMYGVVTYAAAKFYRATPEFMDARCFPDSYLALQVSLTNFGPYYTLAMTQSGKHVFAGLPTTDLFPNPALQELSARAERCLDEQGFVRLKRPLLETPLPERYNGLPSYSEGSGPVLFDGLFAFIG